MKIFKQREYSLKTSDYLTAKHEAGHFIFYIRGIKELYGITKAKNLLGSTNLYIYMENRDPVTGKRRATFKKPNGLSLSNNKELESNFYLGGLAIDVVTGREYNGVGVLTLVKKDLEEYDKMYRKEPKSLFGVPGNDLVRAMICLIQGRKYRGPSDVLSRMDKLSRSMSKTELQVIEDISRSLETELKRSQSVTLDLHEYVLKLF